MEGRAVSMLIIALLASFDVAASTTTLQPLGSSATLRALALTPRALATQVARPAEPALLGVAMPASSVPRAGAASTLAVAPAPLHASPAGAGASPAPRVRTSAGVNIEGLRAGPGGVTAALGEQQYVQLADGLLAVYRKADGALLQAPVLANAMFFDAPSEHAHHACGAPGARAAAVHFDQLAKRWIVLHRARADGLYRLCLAVSTSADATGSYYRYALQMPARYFDDPQLAVWPGAYYVSMNLFDSAAGSYRGPRICGLERGALLRGARASVRCRDLGPRHAPVAAASLEGSASPAQGVAPGLFLSLDTDGSGRGQHLLLWRFSFASNHLDAPVALPVTPYVIACAGGLACVAQPAPGALLDGAGDRPMPRPVLRHADDHASLLVTHAIRMADGQLGVRWYDIRDPLGAPRVYQQGSLAPDTDSRYMGSIGLDKAGNIAIGYAVSSGDTPAGIRYTGRERTDPPGRLQAEQVVFNGNGAQPGPARMARASGALALDPIDGCTFWYTQQYLPSTGAANWHTRIASFKFEACR